MTSDQRTAARVAAIAFLLSFALVVYINFGLRAGLFVIDDIPGSVQRIAAAESVLRLSVALDLVYCVGSTVALSALYVVLAAINRRLALLAVLLKGGYIMTTVLMALNLLNVVRITTDVGYMIALGEKPLQALVRLTWTQTWDHYYVGLVLWSVSATIFAWLWRKSRYIPSALAIFGIAASAWCAFCATAYIINAEFSRTINLWAFDMPMVLFDIALSVSLLVRGLGAQPNLPISFSRES